MARSFQHGTGNRTPRYYREFQEAQIQSNELTRIKARLNELLSDDERDSVWDKICEGNPGVCAKRERILSMISVCELRNFRNQSSQNKEQQS